jgi:F-type H+-transporting ATPase subunit c
MMSKVIRSLVFVFAFVMVGGFAFAADSSEAAIAEARKWGYMAAGIAAALATIGGAYGIGKLATAAMEGTARQPEAGGMIRVSMIIAAALIEGFTFFAMIIAIIMASAKPNA